MKIIPPFKVNRPAFRASWSFEAAVDFGYSATFVEELTNAMAKEINKEISEKKSNFIRTIHGA